MIGAHFLLIAAEMERVAPLFREAISKFTEEDWDKVYVGAHKLTAELKVALAIEASGGPNHITTLLRRSQ